jgi:hypothetical protein
MIFPRDAVSSRSPASMKSGLSPSNSNFTSQLTSREMDNDYLDAPTPAQQGTSRYNISVRQPVSCEPCRHRKIKCSRTKPTCETCQRRRCADRCVYKSARDGDSSNLSSSSNDELLNRISILEHLLEKHTGAHIPGRNENHSMIPSPPMRMGQTSQLSPESLISESTNQSYPTDYQTLVSGGVLTSTSSGNVRYEPRSSQWTSVLANTNLSIETPSLEDQENSTIICGFPFTDTTVPSTDELLSLLPPIQQCDCLKNRYFAVFSPVGLLRFLKSSLIFELFHILHDPTFHAQYGQFLEIPSSAPVSWLAILFVLLSLAVTGLEDNDPILRDLARGTDPCTNIRVLSRRYREAAMKCLAKQGVFCGKHNVQSLQALIMLIYAMGHSQDHTWVLLGNFDLLNTGFRLILSRNDIQCGHRTCMSYRPL